MPSRMAAFLCFEFGFWAWVVLRLYVPIVNLNAIRRNKPVFMGFCTGVGELMALKRCDFQKPFQGKFPAWGVAINKHAKVGHSLVGQVISLLFLCLPVFCEAGSLPVRQEADKELNVNSAWAVAGCVRVFDFTQQPVAYGWAGFVEVVTTVAPQVEAKASPKSQQETNEVKKDDVVRYGFGDLIKDHGLMLLISFLLGFSGFAFAPLRKYSD